MNKIKAPFKSCISFLMIAIPFCAGPYLSFAQSFGKISEPKLIVLLNPDAPTAGQGHLAVALAYKGRVYYWSYSRSNPAGGWNNTLPYAFRFDGGINDFVNGRNGQIMPGFTTNSAHNGSAPPKAGPNRAIDDEISSDIQQYTKSIWKNIDDNTANKMLSEATKLFSKPYNLGGYQANVNGTCNNCADAVERLAAIDPATGRLLSRIRAQGTDKVSIPAPEASPPGVVRLPFTSPASVFDALSSAEDNNGERVYSSVDIGAYRDAIHENQRQQDKRKVLPMHNLHNGSFITVDGEP